MAQAMSDPDSDEPEVEGVEGITEQDSVVDENNSEPNDLPAEEETNFTDNGPVSDAEESRDDSSETIADNA
jgi:hypothetical protein